MPSSPKRIVVIGPESSGKSTLCAALAAELRTVWVPEYARAYLENLSKAYEEEDLVKIAIGQLESEDEWAAQAADVLICDTDLQVVRVWSETRYGRCHRHILEWIAGRRYDAYLLTYPDLPWEPDPQREYPDVADRLCFWHQYHDVVQASGLLFADLRGPADERLQRAVQAIRQFGLISAR